MRKMNNGWCGNNGIFLTYLLFSIFTKIWWNRVFTSKVYVHFQSLFYTYWFFVFTVFISTEYSADIYFNLMRMNVITPEVARSQTQSSQQSYHNPSRWSSLVDDCGGGQQVFIAVHFAAKYEFVGKSISNACFSCSMLCLQKAYKRALQYNPSAFL